MQPSKLAKRAWLLLFLSITAFYLWGLGSMPLVGPDEPRYAQAAREMLLRRDLITPTLGGMPWFEKPALLYWMMILSYRLLGVNEYAARLGPALCGLLTAAFVYWIGRTARADSANHGNEVGIWSTMVWLSSLGAIGFSRAASFDMVLTMTVTGAFAFFLASSVSARLSPEQSPSSGPASRMLVGFYFFTGLSVLAKGLIGFVIIFGVIALYFLIRREWPAANFARSLIWGIPLALAVAAVWFGPMIARHGWTFIDQFIIQHHFARFTSNKYHHPGPIYYYVPCLVGLALPWTIVLGAALVSARRWAWRGASPLDRLRVFALLWLLFPIAFFSISGSKLIAYILPVLPAAALLIGERINCALKAVRGETMLRLTGGILILLAVAGYWYTRPRFELSTLCLAAGVLPLLLVGVAAVVRPQLRRPLFLLAAVAIIISSISALRCVAPAAARRESVRDLLITAAARGYESTEVVQLHTIERTAEFYAANRITYQADGEPAKLEGVKQVFEAARRNHGVVLCFVPRQFTSQLTSSNEAQTEVLADNGRVALVAVRMHQ
ncbi:MAG TPA: glycosyltransferase family 39 protein [Pyrinomonadaceae bacterium]|nr:glycosyltransferase family 39 protein [Pyrinomonadaceae bacterium]